MPKIISSSVKLSNGFGSYAENGNSLFLHFWENHYFIYFEKYFPLNISSIVWSPKYSAEKDLQTRHVYSTLKPRGKGRFNVVSTWNTRVPLVGFLALCEMTWFKLFFNTWVTISFFWNWPQWFLYKITVKTLN